jgi:hypothetical protein
MEQPAGNTIKLEAMKNAASLFISLLRSGTDYIGLTRYNETSQNVVTLDLLDENEQAALDTLAGLQPDGATGIGGALRTASQQYALSPTDADPVHRKVMVLLSDGKENRDPRIRPVLDGYDDYPGLFNEHPDLLAYSVGLGDADMINVDRLQEITNRGEGGFFHVTGALEGLRVFELETFYFKVFADAIDHDMVVDPTYLVLPEEKLEVPVGIISEDREALFFCIGDLPEEAYIFELVDPSGQVITSSATLGGMSVQVQRLNNWSWFRVRFPQIDIDMAHVGTWVFRVRIDGPQKWLKGDGRGGYIGTYGGGEASRIAVAASVKSNYKLHASAHPQVVLTGEPLNLRAALTNGGWPAPNSSVFVTVTRPDGGVDQVELLDKGAAGNEPLEDGIFTNHYTKTDQRGVYDCYFRSTGVTDRGEAVVREARLSQFVGKPVDDPRPDDPCKPSRAVTILVWVIAVLLVLVAVRVFWIRRP